MVFRSIGTEFGRIQYSHAIRLQGSVNVAQLKAAIEAVVARHEVLRTSFRVDEAGEPYQLIEAAVTLPWQEVDLTSLAEAEKASALKALLKTEAHRPLHLSEAPLLRGLYIQLTEREASLMLTVHHSVADGWSIGILAQEISAHYQGIELPPLSIQYADFAMWQRAYLHEGSPAYTKQLTYWQDQLKGVPALLELPLDYPRPAMQRKTGAHYEFTLSTALTAQLNELAKEEQATLFMVLLSAFGTLLYRYTQQEDIIIGSPIANRNRRDIEGLIGFFVNTLALRLGFRAEATFKTLLASVKQTTLAAYAHQDLPFERLVETLKLERSLSYNPLFQVMLVLQNNVTPNLALPDINARAESYDYEIAKFDLTLNFTETTGGLSGNLEYNTALFKPETIVCLVGHFKVLVEGIVQQPDVELHRLPLLLPQERQQLLVEWNKTEQDYPQDKTIHQLFEEQVERTPDNIAVVFEDQRLTYRELNQKANQLAYYLIKQGVKPDTLVAICLERSLELMIGLLGILKAGGAYVPLDPSYPIDRLHYMLEDTQAPVAVTHSTFKALFQLQNTTPIYLDQAEHKLAKEKTTTPNAAVSAHHLVYVIYTSGSTGKPKGVLINHSNVIRLFNSTDEWYGFNSSDVWTLFHSYAFDFSVWEIWGALFYGAQLVIVSRLVAQSTEQLYKLLLDKHVTVFNQTPSSFKRLIEYEKSLSSPNKLDLRFVIFGGEVLDFSMLKEWINIHPEVPKLINMYGITETTIHVTYMPLDQAQINTGKSSIIGKHISDLKIYILDGNKHLAPIAVPGELYVGGPGLARGYLNRPELTAERFIENPFASEEDKQKGWTRLYKTGDLCRFLPDGNIEYLGRLDHQVKLRGFRIECGEIETVLTQHPGVKEAVVMTREDELGDKRLVAYLILNANTALSEPELITELRQIINYELPDYMMPSAFVCLEVFPLTSNGKLDRKALPRPEKIYHDAEKISPQTHIEKQLASIWSEVLNIDVEQISINDNFFAIGGDSLKSVKIIYQAQIRGLELSIQDIFVCSNLAELAKIVESKPKANIFAKENFAIDALFKTVLPIQPKGTKAPLFLIHPAGGLGLIYFKLKDLLLDQPIYSIQNPYFGKEDYFNSFDEMVEMYVKSIKELYPHGPYQLGGWSFGGHVAVEMALKLAQQGEVVNKIILIDTMNAAKFSSLFDEALLDEVLEDQELYHDDDFQKVRSLMGEAEFEAIEKKTLVEMKRSSALIKNNRFSKEYNGRVVLIKAKKLKKRRYKIPKDINRETTNLFNDPFLGWYETFPNIEIYSTEGIHEELFFNENAYSLKKAIKQALTSPSFAKTYPHAKGAIERNMLAAAERNDDHILQLLRKYKK